MTTQLIDTQDLTRQLMRRGLGQETLPVPFQGREIALLTTYIAGMEHHNSTDEIHALPAEGELRLLREPANPHDDCAIALLWQGRCIGYVPRRKNEVLTALMDAGKTLSARLLATRPKHPEWMEKAEGFDREIRIYLVDF
jgi:hypothetical protein